MISVTTSNTSVQKKDNFHPLTEGLPIGGTDLFMPSYYHHTTPLPRKRLGEQDYPGEISSVMTKLNSILCVEEQSQSLISTLSSHPHKPSLFSSSKKLSHEVLSPGMSIVEFAQTIRTPTKSQPSSDMDKKAESPEGNRDPTTNKKQEVPLVDRSENLFLGKPKPAFGVRASTKRKREIPLEVDTALASPAPVRRKQVNACKMDITDYSPSLLAMEFDHQTELSSDNKSVGSEWDGAINHLSIKRKGGESILELVQNFAVTTEPTSLKTRKCVSPHLLPMGSQNESQLLSKSDSFADLLGGVFANPDGIDGFHTSSRETEDYTPTLLAMEFDYTPECDSEYPFHESESVSTAIFDDLKPPPHDAAATKAAGESLLDLIAKLLPSDFTSNLDNLGLRGTEEEERTRIKVAEFDLASSAYEPTPFANFKSQHRLGLATAPTGFRSEGLATSSTMNDSSYQVDDSSATETDDSSTTDTESSWEDLDFEIETLDSSETAPTNSTCLTSGLAKLQRSMAKTRITQDALQERDRANGLPKSHCQTMVNCSRSREQLLSGLVLQKWNGVPLLNLPGAKIKVTRRMFRGSKLTGLERGENYCIP
eukprot:CAMPEP_0119004110 /NCGR_PEP_ID=MMETSP1176-20130426/958_1 /TAXON_ID=265551 /ORGANISM="Synedropsis recta cf, Strain CCMP1620" /LENGTH=595 /DNA_ID=CAMNT_0006955783 /DNA_START=58 /DNA_END=1845 /DNA_ORIENTATION=+